MREISHGQKHAFVRSIVTLVLLCTMSASCAPGDQGRTKHYATPSELCGTNVPVALVDPLMPAGKEIVVETVKTRVPEWTRCRVHVDGEKVLSLATEWWGKDTSITAAASLWRGSGVESATHMASDGSYMYGDRGAASKVVCKRPSTVHRASHRQLVVVVYSLPPSPADEQAMKNLTAGYARAVAKSRACNWAGRQSG